MDYIYDMDAINREYFSKRGFTKSNKNQAADYFTELADSLGFSLDLLKEGHNPNARYCFHEEDVDTVFAILDSAKSAEGKRLRCRDYKGAGWRFIASMVEALLYLMQANGATFMTVWEQEYHIAVKTGFVIQTEILKELKPELSADLDEKFFLSDSLIYEEDGFTHADRYTFLNFVLEHVDFDAKDIRGVYWFWKTDNEGRSTEETIKAARQLRTKTPEEMESFKKRILGRIHWDQAVENDEDLQKILRRWHDIETGGGKLKDNKLRKPLAFQALEKIKQHAEEHLPVDSHAAFSKDDTDGAEDITFAEAMFEGEEHLAMACNHYSSYKQYRKEHPLESEDDKMMVEIMFEGRFGVLLL